MIKSLHTWYKEGVDALRLKEDVSSAGLDADCSDNNHRESEPVPQDDTVCVFCIILRLLVYKKSQKIK